MMFEITFSFVLDGKETPVVVEKSFDNYESASAWANTEGDSMSHKYGELESISISPKYVTIPNHMKGERRNEDC